MSDTEPVLYDVDAGVATLTLNRPERRNGWTSAMEERYFALLDRAATDDDVRAIVVTGAGDSFCPGLDPTVLDDVRGGGQYSANRRPTTHATTVPKPVIAAINGNCAGIGLLQALLCDLRFAAPGAKFSTAFARRGLHAEDGASWLLPRLVGAGRAMDLLLSGRVFGTEDAVGYGIVTHLTEPGAAYSDAVEYARDLAQNVSPAAMAVIKNQVWHDQSSTLEESRVRAQYLLPVIKRQPDFQEGVTSFVEKRRPAFAPYQPFHF